MTGKISLENIRTIIREHINTISTTATTTTTATTATNQTPVFNPQRALKDIRAIEQKNEQLLQLAISEGYNPNLEIKNTQVSNELYKGDVYSVKYDGYNITVTNKTQNYTVHLNLCNLLAGMNDEDKIKFMKTIQTLPAEVLEDLSIEVDRLTSATGQNMNTRPTNQEFVAGGFYRPSTDSITTKPQHIVHELGHAIDYQGKNNFEGKNNYSRVANNPKFVKAFQIGLARFKRAGNKQYNYDDKKTWSDTAATLSQNSNYCTANENELWAELYTALTTGKCKSYNTIVTYFSEAIDVGKELLAEIRSENNVTRHNSSRRRFINALA